MLSLSSHLPLLACLVAAVCGQSMSETSGTSTTTVESTITMTLSWDGSASASTTASTNSSSSNATASGTSSANATATGKYPITTDNSCGPDAGFMCLTSGINPCCSGDGFCGGTTAYCATGCQPAYGTCGAAPNATLGNPACSWAGTIGTSPRCDGRCGSEFNDAVCNPDAGADEFARYGVFEYGPCCSVEGFCGNSTAHCGAGCQSGCNGSDSVTGSSAGGATVTVTAGAAATTTSEGGVAGRVEVEGLVALGLSFFGALMVV